jgi:hypothetical protein
MTLAEKLHAIQKLARKVPKRGVHEHGWSYMQVEDVVSIATRFMARHNLILTPDMKNMARTPNERGGSFVDIVFEWALHDVESKETLHYQIPGSGFDFESKGTAKALTDSRKSAMILIFNLKGGDDPERAPVTRAAAKDRQQEIAAQKIANAEAGRGVDANAPKLFYEFFEESQTALITGDKDLMKGNADLLKAFKLGGKVIVTPDQLEALKVKLEERGVPLSNLRTQ